jgi:hypothetical protein
MPTAPPPTTLTWLRWLVFGGLVGGLLWGCVQVALDTVAQQQQRPLTALEFRYLELVEATRADWHPDFSQGFSEPLKKWAPHRTDGVAQPLWPWLLAGWVNAADPAVLLKQAGLFRVGGLLGGLLVLAFAGDVAGAVVGGI